MTLYPILVNDVRNHEVPIKEDSNVTFQGRPDIKHIIQCHTTQYTCVLPLHCFTYLTLDTHKHTRAPVHLKLSTAVDD